jgi:hypothetical protein
MAAGRSSQVRLRGRGFLPGPLCSFTSSRTLWRETVAKGVSGGTILRYIAGNRESNMDLPYGARTTRISSWLDSMRNGFEENPPI